MKILSHFSKISKKSVFLISWLSKHSVHRMTMRVGALENHDLRQASKYPENILSTCRNFWGGIEVNPFFRKLTNSSEMFEISTYFFQKISFSCISEFSKCFVCHKTTRIRALKRADFRKPHKNFEGGNIVSRKPYRVLLKTCVFER